MADIITTLHPRTDEDSNLYPNIKKENIPSKSIDTTKLDDAIVSLLNSINELHPSGTDTEANILAFSSNKGIYVGTDTGHWYYWNGAQYVDGGTYLANTSVDSDINFLSVQPLENKKISQLIAKELNATLENLYINSSSGTSSINSQYGTTDYLSGVYKAECTYSYYLRAYYYKADKTYISASSEMRLWDYSMMPANAKLVRFSIRSYPSGSDIDVTTTTLYVVTLNSEVNYADINILKLDLLNKVNNSVKIIRQWEYGGISKSTGVNQDGSSYRISYIRCDFIDIDNFKEIIFDGIYNLIYYLVFYNSNKERIGNTGNLTQLNYKKETILASYSNCKYFRIVINPQVVSNIKPEENYGFNVYEVVNYNVSKNQNDVFELNKLNRPNTNLYYYGEPIDLRLNTFKKINATYMTLGGQDADVYNNVVVGFNASGQITLKNVNTGEQIAVNKPIRGDIIPHANSVCFGVEKYDNDDEFPLIYVNAYNNPGLPLATCYAFRVFKVNNEYTAEIVQTISIGFVNDIDKWPASSESRPYGNFVIDKTNSIIYAYVPDYRIGKLRFYGFNLPTLVDGSNIILNYDDKLTYFETELFNYPQGCVCYNSKLFLLFGWENIKYLIVVDLASKQIVNIIDFYKNGFDYNLEPEAIWICNEKIYITMSGNVYILEF